MTDVTSVLDRSAARAARRRVGVVVGYLAPDGTTTVRCAGRTAGTPGADPVVAGSRFEIGSITKTVTAFVLARAVVRGELSLDTPVGDLVPEVAGLSRDGVPVTLGHLATHRSGLPRAHLPTVRGTVDMLRGRDPWRDHTEPVLLEAIRSGRLRRTPGTGRPAYSNSGFGLLGIALCRHARLGFGELVRDQVTGPLHLEDTGVHADATEDQRARTTAGHHRRRSPAPDWHLDGLPGAGALVSTAGDMLTWGRTHLVPPPGELGDAVRLATSEHGRRIGLAWQRTFDGASGTSDPATPAPRGSDRLVWHNGGTGGFRSVLTLRPDAGDAVVVLSNHARFVDLVAMSVLKQVPSV